MAEQPSRKRRIVKRVVWTIAGVVVSLASYVSSGPIVLCSLRDSGAIIRFPVLWDVCGVIYAPGGYWYDHPEVLGHDQYVRYCDWSVATTNRFWRSAWETFDWGATKPASVKNNADSQLPSVPNPDGQTISD